MIDFPPMMQDIHEPQQIFDLAVQSIPIEWHPLNTSGLADYAWTDYFGNIRQVERKQWGEILGDINSVEEQLRREIIAADATDLIIEGIVKSTQYGLDAYVWRNDRGRASGYYLSHSFGDSVHPRSGLYAMVMSWLWSLDKAGISIWFTFSQEDTAKALVAFYKSSMREEHGTLNRYLKPRIGLKHLNPHVLTLMGIEGAGLGQKRAQALIAKYGSVWDVINADVKDLAGTENMGKITAEKILRAIGKIT